MNTAPTNVQVRKAVAGDISAVLELCLLVERQHEQYWPLRWRLKSDIRDRYDRWLHANLNEPRWLIAVAEASGRPNIVLGALVMAVQDDIPIYADDRYAFIHDMAVITDARRQGIGSQLVNYAAAWAKSQGVKQLRLMAAAQNDHAVDLFRANGFRTTYHEMVLPLQQA